VQRLLVQLSCQNICCNFFGRSWGIWNGKGNAVAPFSLTLCTRDLLWNALCIEFWRPLSNEIFVCGFLKVALQCHCWPAILVLIGGTNYYRQNKYGDNTQVRLQRALYKLSLEIRYGTPCHLLCGMWHMFLDV
jgi:hypothetical protein